ncbi:MAG: fused MFS/spermidine synthase, partial [Planctomycetales bacterium]|nr:fused MFS/spermidine synthase [Planctomycetales bacterium]
MNAPSTDSPAASGRLQIAFAVFFASGFAGLVYEISWSRQIGLLLGNTAAAASIVLASYFAGMAIGYATLGRVASRWPSRCYAVLELAAAAWAVAIPLLLGLAETHMAALLDHPSPALQVAIRAVFCFALLAPATIALGGTLPAMAAWLAAHGDRDARSVAWAYGLNTFGGLVGALSATWILLVFVGVAGSSRLAALVSTSCAVVAWLASVGEGASPKAHATKSAGQTRWPVTALMCIAAAAGFCSLALEVLYARLFALIFHNSTYTFGLVVAATLAALAVAAWVSTWLVRRVDPVHAAAWALLLAAEAIPLSTFYFLERTMLDYFQGEAHFFAYVLACASLVAVVTIPSMLLLGLALPLMWASACGAAEQQADEPNRAGRIGPLAAANTVAAGLGALAASFLLLPTLGLWGSFAATAVVALAAALLAAWRAGQRSATYWVGVAGAVVTIVAVWQTSAQRHALNSNQKLERSWESAYGWIDVVRDDRTGTRSLRENVHYTHGSTASSEWERRQGNLALLLHPQPRRVAFLGSGTGATAGGAMLHPEVESITVVELIPEVVAAARLFADSNLGVLEDKRTRIEIDDARHYLLATDQRFDVIVADLFVPWETKTGYLYTVDHYRVARSRLRSGGLYCQWLPMWQLGEREFAMIADSMAEVFPQVTLWWCKARRSRSVIALVGSDGHLKLDAAAIDRRLDAMWRAHPERDAQLADAHDVARLFVGSWRRRVGAPLNTDEHPR